MRNKNLIVGLLMVALLAATLWLGTKLGEQKSAQVAAPEVTKTGPPATASLPILPNLNQTPAPWAGSTATSGASANPTLNEHQKNLAELKEMQAAIAQSIQQNHGADPKQVLQMLDKLKQVNGSSVVGGVNIDNLRNTLTAATEAQSVALEMNNEIRKPGGPDPVKLKAYTQRLQQLQAQLLVAQPTMPSVSK